MADPREPVAGWGDDDAGLPPDSQLEEAAYLVSRGVRPMALAGTCAADPMVMLRVSTRLATAAMRFDALPFVIDFGDGRADCGYAAAKWVIDLYEATWRDRHPHRHQITGLLLGYSPSAIARHEENGTSRRFAAPATGSGSAIRRLASGEPLPDMPQIESQSNKTVPSDQHAKESDHA